MDAKFWVTFAVAVARYSRVANAVGEAIHWMIEGQGDVDPMSAVLYIVEKVKETFSKRHDEHGCAAEKQLGESGDAFSSFEGLAPYAKEQYHEQSQVRHTHTMNNVIKPPLLLTFIPPTHIQHHQACSGLEVVHTPDGDKEWQYQVKHRDTPPGGKVFNVDLGSSPPECSCFYLQVRRLYIMCGGEGSICAWC